MAEQLSEVVRGKANAPLRQVEAQFVPHRPAQPGIHARRRRPHGFHQSAQDDAVGFRQPRFQLAEDVELRARQFPPPHQTVCKSGLEHLGIVAGLDHQADLLLPAKQVVESGRECESVCFFECRGDTVLIGGEIHQRLAMALREFGEIMRSAARKTFQRCQRFAERSDQGLRPVEFVVAQSHTRLGMVQR